jgi:hypothetical protein
MRAKTKQAIADYLAELTQKIEVREDAITAKELSEADPLGRGIQWAQRKLSAEVKGKRAKRVWKRVPRGDGTTLAPAYVKV